MTAVRLSAPWILPVDGPAVSDGAVLIGHSGRIEAVGPSDLVPTPPEVECIHLPGAAILPGLVNCHTHLELTGLRLDLPRGKFPAWITGVRAAKSDRTRETFLAAAIEGLRQAHRSGVTTVADTGDSGTVLEALHQVGGSGIAYHEVFGPDPGQVAESMVSLRSDVEHLRRFEGPRVRLGVSPHAPYTVSGPLYRSVACFAAELDLPMSVHLAESKDESALLRGRGRFAERWQARGIPLPDDPDQRGAVATGSPMDDVITPVGWLDTLGVLGPRTLCIHVVQVDARDVELLAQHGVAIAHCPISNRNHGHGTAPLMEFRRAGLRVGVGTDSILSVDATDLLAEVLFAKTGSETARGDERGGEHGAVLTAADAVRLATLGGAEALGLDHEVGSITVGKWGDLCALEVRAAGPEAIEERVLAAGTGAVVGTWLSGRRRVP